MFGSGKQNLTHQATGFLLGLISGCFVSWVYMLNEQNGEVFRKGTAQRSHGSIDTLGPGRNGGGDGMVMELA